MTDSIGNGELVLLGQAGFPPAAIHAQVETICNSPAFDDAEQGRMLLCYLVREALAGRVPSAAAVAAEIGKINFDTKDPFVRAAMGRLRERMERYFEKHANRGEIYIEIPKGEYFVVAYRNTAMQLASYGPPIATILEPRELAELSNTCKVRGRIDELDPDLRVWLVIRAANLHYYPLCRVSRRSSSWECNVSIGQSEGMLDDGEFTLMLVSADTDGDYAFSGYVMHRDSSFGTEMPTDIKVLDSRRLSWHRTDRKRKLSLTVYLGKGVYQETKYLKYDYDETDPQAF